MGIRRRSRPWLPLWGSWRASGEPERAFAVAGLHIGVVIATGYPLSHDAFSIFATAYALSVTATPCQLSHRESQGRLRRQRHPSPAIEPGDPQRCGSTARVTGSSLPAGAKSPSQSRLRRASSPKGRAKGRASPARPRGQVSANPAAQGVSQRESGGAAAFGLLF